MNLRTMVYATALRFLAACFPLVWDEKSCEAMNAQLKRNAFR